MFVWRRIHETIECGVDFGISFVMSEWEFQLIYFIDNDDVKGALVVFSINNNHVNSLVLVNF